MIYHLFQNILPVLSSVEKNIFLTNSGLFPRMALQGTRQGIIKILQNIMLIEVYFFVVLSFIMQLKVANDEN